MQQDIHEGDNEGDDDEGEGDDDDNEGDEDDESDDNIIIRGEAGCVLVATQEPCPAEKTETIMKTVNQKNIYTENQKNTYAKLNN